MNKTDLNLGQVGCCCCCYYFLFVLLKDLNFKYETKQIKLSFDAKILFLIRRKEKTITLGNFYVELCEISKIVSLSCIYFSFLVWVLGCLQFEFVRVAVIWLPKVRCSSIIFYKRRFNTEIKKKIKSIFCGW